MTTMRDSASEVPYYRRTRTTPSPPVPCHRCHAVVVTVAIIPDIYTDPRVLRAAYRPTDRTPPLGRNDIPITSQPSSKYSRARPVATGGDIPAVAVPAYASPADRDALLTAGYQAHVSKPY